MAAIFPTNNIKNYISRMITEFHFYGTIYCKSAEDAQRFFAEHEDKMFKCLNITFWADPIDSSTIFFWPPIPEIRETLPNYKIAQLCEAISEQFKCKVKIKTGAEYYENVNVYNGGSDYQVVNEEWYVIISDNGVLEQP